MATWIGVCPCGKSISKNVRLCFSCAELQLEPIRHAGVMAQTGNILYTAGGSMDQMSGTFKGSELVNRLNAHLGSPFVRLPNLDKQSRTVEIDGHPVFLDFIEMVFNDANCIDGVMGRGVYARTCNSRERAVLKKAVEMYGREPY